MIVLSALFIVCITAQSVAGWRLQNDILVAHGQASVSYWVNLSTGAFLEGLATNWQRGAPHSRDPLKAKSRKETRKDARRFTWSTATLF